MGNELSSGPNRLAISALHHVVKFDKAELLSLQREFNRLASKSPESPYTITQDQFVEAMSLVGIADSDKELMNRIFVLLDKGAEHKINFRQFVVGIAPFVRGNLSERIRFVFDMHDLDGSRTISRDEMVMAFRSLNRSVSFFGDDPMDEDTAKSIVDELYERHDTDKTGTLAYDEFMDTLTTHPKLISYVMDEPAPAAPPSKPTPAASSSAEAAAGAGGEA